jgi:hypothetical protein
MSYEEDLVKLRQQLDIKRKCPHYVLQTYDHGNNHYYGCNKNGLLRGLSFYPNCNMQCKNLIV